MDLLCTMELQAKSKFQCLENYSSFGRMPAYRKLARLTELNAERCQVMKAGDLVACHVPYENSRNLLNLHGGQFLHLQSGAGKISSASVSQTTMNNQAEHIHILAAQKDQD